MTSTYTFIATPTIIATYALPVITRPQQIAYAATSGGVIFVPSLQYNYILRYSGSVSTVWGGYGTGNGQFNSPYAVATDAGGNLYVADTGNNRVQKLDPSGVFQWAVSIASGTTDAFNGPVGVGVDGSGNIWVTDSGNNRLVELNSTGAPVTTISGTFGGAPIYSPQGVAVDTANNWVYVSNLHCCIFRFKTDGTFLNCLGSYGSSGNGYFQAPFAMAVNPSGSRLYVADPNLMKVQILDPSGNFLGSYGGYSQFGTESPTGIAVDGSGNVYLADIGTGSIQEYGP